MKPSQLVFTVVISATIAAGITYYLGVALNEGALLRNSKETRLEQIKRTGILRCGYFNAPPFDIKDPNTGKISGVMYDLVEEIGRQLKLKIDWGTEVAPGQMLSDLNLGRIDIMCTPFFQTPGRAREADFTKPFIYMPVYMYVRTDDRRFDNDIMAANNPNVRFSALDGEYSSIGVTEHFPRAQKIALPDMAATSEIFLNVVNGKADAVIDDFGTFLEWSLKNPGKMRIAGNKPISVIALGMPLPANEPAFKAMLDTTIAYLLDSGFVDKLLDKYESTRLMPRVAKPYILPTSTNPNFETLTTTNP